MQCQYFLLCDREADGLAGLGPVPCCQRCADRMEQALLPFAPPEPEQDFGGAFDGFIVISDADPGL